MSIQLTKRNYLGKGYHHLFKNEKTGELVYEFCTEQEYIDLGEKDIQPTKEGYIWINSAGGTVKVDSPTGYLGENEYTETDTATVACLANQPEGEAVKFLPKGAIIDNVAVNVADLIIESL